MKLKAPEIKTRNKKVVEYHLNCPICEMEITSRTEKHLLVNLNNHMEKHKKKTKQVEEPRYTY